MMIWIQLLAGLALLLIGGEALVRGSVAVAMRMGVSPLLIGLTLVGFGTSTPELVATLEAALAGRSGIAIGNVVGSNIANILLILGLSAAIFPLATTKEAFRRDGAVLVLSAFGLLGGVLSGVIGRLAGGCLLLLLVAYSVYTFRSERKSPGAAAAVLEAETVGVAPRHMSIGFGLTLSLGGIAAVIYGASLLIESAVVLAREAGISEAVIGLTLVALGTSLPELVTAIMAAIRRHADVAFGNLVGSNIYNSLGIAGVTAIVEPIAVPSTIARFDIWIMLGATILLAVFACTGWRINRWEGGLLLVAYAAYLAVLLSSGITVTPE